MLVRYCKLTKRNFSSLGRLPSRHYHPSIAWLIKGYQVSIWVGLSGCEGDAVGKVGQLPCVVTYGNTFQAQKSVLCLLPSKITLVFQSSPSLAGAYISAELNATSNQPRATSPILSCNMLLSDVRKGDIESCHIRFDPTIGRTCGIWPCSISMCETTGPSGWMADAYEVGVTRGRLGSML